LSDSTHRVYAARLRAFYAGAFSIMLPFVAFHLLGYALDMDAWSRVEDHPTWLNVASGMTFAVVVGVAQWLAVNRHDPRLKEAADE
jgi:hypothetical protein